MICNRLLNSTINSVPNVIHENTISDGFLRKVGQKRRKKFFTKSQYTMVNLCQEISSWFLIQQRTENHPDAASLAFWNFSNHRISGKRPWLLITYGLRHLWCITVWLWTVIVMVLHFLYIFPWAKVKKCNSKQLVIAIITSAYVYVTAMEFPAIILVIVLLLKTGRRLTLLILYLICGFSLLATMAIPR